MCCCHPKSILSIEYSAAVIRFADGTAASPRDSGRKVGGRPIYIYISVLSPSDLSFKV